MPETIDVTKMKVADLKRELKVRGLAITGNKNELADRLQAALIDGELLDDAAISGEDLLEDEDTVLTDEDEQKILDENELLKSPDNATDLSAAAPPATATPKKVLLKRKTSFTISAESAATPTDASALKLVRLHSAGEACESGAHSESLAAVKKVAQLTPQERLELRAKKFGLTVAAKTPISMEVNAEKEAELLKKRAERFGCVVSSKMAQLDAAERLQKRKERFGGAVAVAKSESVVSVGSSDVWAEKAKLRLERFKSSEAAPTDAVVPTLKTATGD